jgi:hypothetical protein
MLELTAKDIMRLRSPGGEIFTRFVDSIICASMYIYNVDRSHLHTNERTNQADGGVDTKIDNQIGPSEWFRSKTIWQYKATSHKEITKPKLKAELNKSFSKECIISGYDYRFCICDELTAKKKTEWEKFLNDEAKKINPSASALVLTTSDIVRMVNDFPAICLKTKGIPNDAFQTFDTWEITITDLVKEYVPTDQYENIKAMIHSHTDFNKPPNELCISIYGAPGSGKTRMVYECLKDDLIRHNVIYCLDEGNVHRFITILSHDDQKKSKVIIVADEYSPRMVDELKTQFTGLRDRIRIITIDNQNERLSHITPETFIEPPDFEITNQILTKNFPLVPPDRRIKYANLSKGFVRLAADMCKYDHLIALESNLHPIIENVRQYYSRRLKEDEQITIEALSILIKVGFKDNVNNELKQLCSYLNLDENKTKEQVLRLKEHTGFINIGGRYFYITPDIIARIAFENAWRRWFALDSKNKLESIPDELLYSFLKRVSISAPQAIRNEVSSCFSNIISEIEVKDLFGNNITNFFLTILKTDPDIYLKILHGLIDNASLDDLSKISGQYTNDWGPRRHIVSLMDELKAFPEYFFYVERILFKLTITENEQNIGNNATHIWRSCFNIFPSGTAVPFQERFDILRQHINSDDKKEASLGFYALSNIMHTGGVRFLPSKFSLDKIPPEEWCPKTDVELVECYKLIIGLVKIKLTDSDNHEKIVEFLFSNFSLLIEWGFVDDLYSVFSVLLPSDNDSLKIRLITLLDKHIKYRNHSGFRVESWKKELLGDDLHSQILDLVGVGRFDYPDEKKFKFELVELSQKILASPVAEFEKELPWLNSDQAKDARSLGYELGKIDTGSLINYLLDLKYLSGQYNFSKGYIAGCLYRDVPLVKLAYTKIEKIKESNPKIAFSLFLSGGEKINAFDNCFSIIKMSNDKNELITELLRYLPWSECTISTVFTFIEYVIKIISKEFNRNLTNALLLFFHFKLQTSSDILTDKDTFHILLNFLKICNSNLQSVDSYELTEFAGKLFNIDKRLISNYLFNWLVSSNISMHDPVQEIIIKNINGNEVIILEEFKKLLEDDTKRCFFMLGRYKKLLQDFSDDSMIKFFSEIDIESRRVLARFLPAPYYNNDMPVFPKITRFILEKYGEDDDLFNEFCSGLHSLQMYSGDISGQHKKEAELAKTFFTDGNKIIKKWAHCEHSHAIAQAEYWKRLDEEIELE